MNARHLLLDLYRLGYERLLRPLIFTRSPEAAHRDAMRLLAALDGSKVMCDLMRGGLNRGGAEDAKIIKTDVKDNMTDAIYGVPIESPGVGTPFMASASHPSHPRSPAPLPLRPCGSTHLSPLTLAAGFVKGRGFADEDEALRAVEAGENIIPGWRAMPALVGAVEFGSFTRYPRLGNSGAILWRDPATRSTQNRIGLRNPGARAAARFLARHRADFPWYIRYGINIAVSPGVSDEAQEIAEVYESMSLFLDAGLRPGWFTLNLSCPNTEDDPEGNQTAAHARALCSALLAHPGLSRHEPHPPTPSPYTARGSEEMRSDPIPLWIKIGPDLGAEQYAALMAVGAEVGIGAIIATNTLARAVPQALTPNPLPLCIQRPERGVPLGEGLHTTPLAPLSQVYSPFGRGVGGEGVPIAGVGGGSLHIHALDAVRHLAAARERLGAQVCIVGCGGVLDGESARALLAAGADALQYWSALIYRGPLAAAVIQRELDTIQDEDNREGAKDAKSDSSLRVLRAFAVKLKCSQGRSRMDDSLKVARALLEIGAVGFSLMQPIKFKSGILSPMYVDNRRLPYHPAQWRVVIEAFAALVRDGAFACDVIAGVAVGGVPHSAALGYLTGIPSVFVRKEAKEHGTGSRVEGGAVDGKRVVLIEDMVTTGGSSLAAVAALREEGAIVTDLLAIISYDFREAAAAMFGAGILLNTLTRVPVVLEEARASGRLNEATFQRVQDWYADPYGWSG